ncbi:predicted protein [Histoplasma capsulatum var. duboisii H88]|uniref:Predicted protein n=2 Tax=Ajellomyces capsulatus TaxID=5037 RepID=F0UAZ8_AJEC8|nr:predicted protein [Histoplasma capsulatum H143]EGC42961.1 predicted protein [Histoplasma capsulatum var. duboisii H88]
MHRSRCPMINQHRFEGSVLKDELKVIDTIDPLGKQHGAGKQLRPPRPSEFVRLCWRKRAKNNRRLPCGYSTNHRSVTTGRSGLLNGKSFLGLCHAVRAAGDNHLKKSDLDSLYGVYKLIADFEASRSWRTLNTTIDGVDDANPVFRVSSFSSWWKVHLPPAIHFAFPMEIEPSTIPVLMIPNFTTKEQQLKLTPSISPS